MKVISWKNMPIFTEIILLLIRQTQCHMVKGIINAIDHMEFWVATGLFHGHRYLLLGMLVLLLPFATCKKKLISNIAFV